MQYIRQDLIEQITQEVLAELQNRSQQYEPVKFRPVSPQQYGPTLKQALKQELLAEMELEAAASQAAANYNPLPNTDPYRAIANTVIDESMLVGAGPAPSANQTRPLFSGMTRNSSGQLRGLLYGLGAVALGALVLPSVGNKFRSVVSRTVEDGTDLIDRAKSVVVRAKEGLEDIVAEASFKRFQSQFMDNDDKPQP